MRARERGANRLLATVMFTDIVGSTELADRLGDRGWKSLIARHNSIVRRQLKRHEGRELDTAGDGFFMTFKRPAQAIACARSIIRELQPLDLEIRAAVHMGEVEVMDRKFGGIAVHAASRVLAMAAPGEILVTSVVRDVVAGSDITFSDRGVHELRGVSGEWHILAVEPENELEIDSGTSPGPETGRLDRRPSMPVIVTLVLIVAVVAVIGTAVAVGALNQRAPVVPRPNTVVKFDAQSGAASTVVAISDPTDLAIADGALWALSVSGRTVNRVDLGSAATSAVGLPAAPTGLAAGDGAIWITTGFGSLSGDAGVLRVATTTSALDDSIPLDDGVDGVAVGEGSVWVTNRLQSLLTRIDLVTRVVSGEVALGDEPGAVAIGQGSVWVADAAGESIWRLSAATMTEAIEIPLAIAPHDLAVGFDSVYVTSTLDNSVIEIDIASNSIRQTVGLAGPPRGVAVGQDAVWVALSSGAVVRIDPEDPHNFREFALAGAPEDVVADGNNVWVSIRE